MKAIKDSAIYLIGELLSRAMPFLLLPYLSRKLGVAGFGELSYYQTFTSLFVLLVCLSQDAAVARYFYFYGKRSLNLVVQTGYAYTLASGGIILLFCLLFQSEIMAYVAISAIFQSFLAVQLSIRQCQKQAIPYTLIQALFSLLSVALTVILLEYFQTELIEKRILAILLANFGAFFIAYLLYRNKIKQKTFKLSQHKTALIYLLGFGLPLILHNASLFLKGQLDRIFIFHRFSETELGLYAMGAQIASILSVILLAVNKACIPYFFEALKKQKITLSQLHKWALYSLFIVPLPALIMWIIPECVIVWLLGTQFIGTKYYIVLFLLSTALMIPYLMLVNYLFYYGKNSFISICSVISTAVYLISLTLLSFTQVEYVPYAGIIGAVTILPVLFVMTKKIKTNKVKETE